ncbi:MAG: laccase domain-containing protein [Betaproteobacteria bacterium]|nr:laccase domain-containing protein [Betaproteobacteria bacterium]
MSDQSETARQKPIDPPQSWLRPNWDFAFALHQPNARKQAALLAERYFVLCTNRYGGLSEGVFSSMNLGFSQGDDKALVAENRRLLEQFLPYPAGYMHLVHGARCVRDDELAAHQRLPEADAAVLTSKGRSLVMLTGDCLPIVLAEAQGQALGMVHAGWRGLACGVIESAVHVLRSAVEPRARLLAWIGPGIGPAAFEVGEDVLMAFPENERGAEFFRKRPLQAGQARWMGDLIAIARRRLGLAGISAVGGGLWCTWHDGSRYFSHRRQAGGGRFATVIAIR